jgi:hypothetical protein
MTFFGFASEAIVWSSSIFGKDSSEPIPVIYRNPEKNLVIIFYVVLEYPERSGKTN